VSAKATAKPKKAGPVVRSMTGYGRATVEDGGRVTAEIRAVNGRFLKLNVKLPGRYGALEDRVKALVTDLGIKRGSVDVLVLFDEGAAAGNYGINAAAVKEYLAQARALAKTCKVTNDVTLSALLPLPGVVTHLEAGEDQEQVWAQARKALAAAIADFADMRERDGAACAADIRGQCAKLAEHVAAIRQLAPESLTNALARFRERLTKLLEQSKVTATLNTEALERELVTMADRMDIGEELVRLQSHLAQMESTLSAGGEAGKKLDFLTQELFRETNTVGSKAQDERITHRVVEMKGLIEKIREQAQNLE
jgi:uncharacterized protein (TIGR00255 family)